MAETIRLTTPVVVPAKTTAEYHVVDIVLDYQHSRIRMRLRGDNDERKDITFKDARTFSALRRIVKRDRAADGTITTTPIRAWLMGEAIAAGEIAGTVTGTDDDDE